MAGIEIENHEYTLHKKNGATIQALIYAAPIVQNDTVTGLRGVAIDITERKRMEEALRESEGKLRTIFENVNDEIIYVDESGIVIDVNRRVKDIFGYTPEEVIGQNFIDMGVIGPDSIQHIITRFDKAVNTEIDDIATLKAQRKDGSTVYVEASTRLIDLDSMGKRFLVVLRDVTERKRMAELTRIQRDLAQGLSSMTNLNEAVAICVETAINTTDMDSGGLYLVDNITRNLNLIHAQGLSYEFISSASQFDCQSKNAGLIMAGKPIYILHHELDLPIHDVRSREGLRAIAIIPVTHDGKTIGCLNIASHIRGEIPLQSQLTLESIGAQIGSAILHLQALEALRESEKRFRTVFDNANDLIILLNTDGTILKINGRSQDSFGFKEEDVIGRSFGELGFARAEDTEEINWLFTQSVKGGKAPELIELEFVHGDGNTIPLEVSRSFISEDDEIENVLVIVRDISERKRAEQEASRVKELEEVDQLRTALLASVSHELRTPLTAIKGMADSLQLPDVEWDAETQQDFLKSISNETDTLTHIVEDLVQMSQLEAGITKMEKVPSTLSSVVIKLKEQFKKSTEMHSLQVDIPNNLPPIEVDEVHIAQVISNLVSNAASYSDTGTRITFTARVVGDEIVVSVRDHGIGVASESIDKIFDRFYRLESGVSHRRGGTGLGLSISRAIVEGHGGKIWAESDGVGKGSTFHFTLPAAP